MEHTEVQSSNLKSIGYDPVDQVLEARFKCAPCKGTGQSERKTLIAVQRGTDEREPCEKCQGKGHQGTYRYEKVPAETYAAVRDAEKQSSEFNRLIVKGGFAYSKQQ